MAEGERRIAVVGITVENRRKSAPLVNNILTEYGELIVGRLGVPYRERDMCVISIIVDATMDQLGALTGKLGSLPGVRAKMALTT
ncbi:MAG TPA: CopG family transcriptional regulator [Firmicutes bacterium]|nr:CopG family transcriptional regulator [Bacillota bacterium]